MTASSGSYVIEGIKKTNSYLFHHFSKVFLYWVFLLTSWVSKVFVPLSPMMENFSQRFLFSVDESHEAILSKCFDDSDDKKGYRLHLLFDCLLLVTSLAVLGFLIGLAFFIKSAIIGIASTSKAPGFVDPDHLQMIITNSNYVFVPFGLISLVYLIFALMVKETGDYVCFANQDLGLGDILYDSFELMRRKWGQLFCINLLCGIKYLTAIVVFALPLILIRIFVDLANPNDLNFGTMIIWIVSSALTFVYLFVLPFIGLSSRMSVYLFLKDNAKAVRNTVLYRKEESQEAEIKEFFPLDKKEETLTNTIPLKDKED